MKTKGGSTRYDLSHDLSDPKCEPDISEPDLAFTRSNKLYLLHLIWATISINHHFKFVMMTLWWRRSQNSVRSTNQSQVGCQIRWNIKHVECSLNPDPDLKSQVGRQIVPCRTPLRNSVLPTLQLQNDFHDLSFLTWRYMLLSFMKVEHFISTFMLR